MPWTINKSLEDSYLHHAPVGSFMPNAFGLHDMHGNVWEPCLERFTPDLKPLPAGDRLRPGNLAAGRGGSYQNTTAAGRASNRELGPPRSMGLGRCARGAGAAALNAPPVELAGQPGVKAAEENTHDS